VDPNRVIDYGAEHGTMLQCRGSFGRIPTKGVESLHREMLSLQCRGSQPARALHDERRHLLASMQRILWEDPNPGWNPRSCSWASRLQCRRSLKETHDLKTEMDKALNLQWGGSA
jgi:hypothetical protein